MLREGTVHLNEFVAIEATLADATEHLRDCSDSPRLDAELLLSIALDVPRSYFFAHPEDLLDDQASKRFRALVTRRQDGVPMAYLSGSKEFWSLEIMVTPATLVPRPETELLVERALALIPRAGPCRVLDLGTGSGAVALAIASERRNVELVATDVSDAAIAVARQNARQLELPNIEFRLGDWTAPTTGEIFDMVVSNPPYVASGDPALLRLKHEPPGALSAGLDGLDAIRQLAADCVTHLPDGGHLLLEHGNDQADAVAELLTRHGWRDIACHEDLAGHPRVTMARR
jgi:release factor glutamine methyltransferase